MECCAALVLSLAGLFAQAEAPSSAAAPREAAESRPVVPGERGHILKMTREMLELAKTHDSERRVDLFLRQARERLREREALETSDPAPERDRVGRGLGESYAKLATIGAAGAIECGAAEGRNMSGAAGRYVDAARRLEEHWRRIAEAQPPQERAPYEGALAVATKAPDRVREAQEAGKAFVAREEARSREREREKNPEPLKSTAASEKSPPAPSKGPSDPPTSPSEAGRREPGGDRQEKDRKDAPLDPSAKEERKEEREKAKDAKTPPEHHPPHPHRPHR